MNSDDALYGRIKNRVLTLSGNNSSIRVDGGCLIVSDGPISVPADLDGPAPPVNERMVTLRLPRSGCPVNRIVVTRPDGFITFSAIRWLHGVGCALVQLDWDGTVLLATTPTGRDRPAIRRAQALAAGHETGLLIMREILRCKLGGQARVARLLGGEDAAALIDRLADQINESQDGTHILGIEGAAASTYWALWADIPVHFARREKVPEHWQLFGFRRPEGSARPRKATTTGGALLNYLYGVVAGEMTVALQAVGLDPGIGVFHADKEGRASLAYDAMEAARPYAEAWLLSCLSETRLSKRDFYEEGDGAIRITRPLTSYLAMTAPLWRRAAETVAGWLAESFAAIARRLDARGVGDNVTAVASAAKPISVPQSRDAGSTRAQISPRATAPSPRPLPAPLQNLPSAGKAYRPALAQDVVPRACCECGRALGSTKRKFCSASCAGVYQAEMRRLIPIAEESTRFPALHKVRASEEARSVKLQRLSAARLAWDKAHRAAGDRTRQNTQAEALGELRRWYAAEIQPRLTGLQPRDLVRVIEVSRVYARQVIAGKVPHPRHFSALAELVGAKVPKAEDTGSANRPQLT